jgi:hypothetical protein
LKLTGYERVHLRLPRQRVAGIAGILRSLRGREKRPEHGRSANRERAEDMEPTLVPLSHEVEQGRDNLPRPIRKTGEPEKPLNYLISDLVATNGDTAIGATQSRSRQS